MPIYRFSALEQGGILLPDRSYMEPHNLGRVVQRMLDHAVLPTLVPGDVCEDITPLYFTRNKFNYILTTPPQPEIAEEATLHFMPRDMSQLGGIVYDANTRKVAGETRTVRLPQDSIILPIASPERNPPYTLRVHELLITSGATALRGMDIPIQPNPQ